MALFIELAGLSFGFGGKTVPGAAAEDGKSGQAAPLPRHNVQNQIMGRCVDLSRIA